MLAWLFSPSPPLRALLSHTTVLLLQEEWWDTVAYLMDRRPLPVNVNVFGTLNYEVAAKDPLAFAAQLVPCGYSPEQSMAQTLRGCVDTPLRLVLFSPSAADRWGLECQHCAGQGDAAA